MPTLSPRLEKFAAAFAAAAGFPKNPPLPVAAPTTDFFPERRIQIMRINSCEGGRAKWQSCQTIFSNRTSNFVTAF